MELKEYTGSVSLVQGITTMMLYRLPRPGSCVLFDSGYPRESSALIELLEQNGLTPAAIVLTHAHTDHAGGAKALRRHFGCPVYLPQGEALLASDKIALHRYNNFFSRSPSFKDILDEQILHCFTHTIAPDQDVLTIEGVPFAVIHTPGHSMDHCCFGTPEGVLFAGDALLSRSMAETAKLPYCDDLMCDRESKRLLLTLPYTRWILAHNGTEEQDLAQLVQMQLCRQEQQLETLYALFDETPISRSEFEARARRALQLRSTKAETMVHHERHFRPYLEHLVNSGRIGFAEKDGMLLYQKL